MTIVLHMGDAHGSADVIRRHAAKAVVWAGSGAARLLLLRTNAGYKFPGGGVEADEDITAALARELDEECGAQLRRAGEEIVTVIERHPAIERPGAVFEMISHYLDCAIASDRRAQRLERYEQDLGLSPEWVGLTRAITVNERAVAAGAASRWTARELSVLCHLRDFGPGDADGRRPEEPARTVPSSLRLRNCRCCLGVFLHGGDALDRRAGSAGGC